MFYKCHVILLLIAVKTKSIKYVNIKGVMCKRIMDNIGICLLCYWMIDVCI